MKHLYIEFQLALCICGRSTKPVDKQIHGLQVSDVTRKGFQLSREGSVLRSAKAMHDFLKLQKLLKGSSGFSLNQKSLANLLRYGEVIHNLTALQNASLPMQLEDSSRHNERYN